MNRKKIEVGKSTLNEVKIKANQFMQNYERELTERQYQKQKLKQNIMLEIMSNRHKTQNQSSSVKENSLSQYMFQESLNHKKIQSRVIEPMSEERNLHHQYTNQSHFNKSYSVPSQPQQHHPIHHTEDKEIQSQNQLNAEVTFKVPKGKNSYIFIDGQSKHTNKQSMIHESNASNINENSKVSKDRQLHSMISAQEKNQTNKKFQPLNYEDQIEESEVVEHIKHDLSPPQHKGAFLTVNEDQSMELTEENQKNVAFDIMESDPNEDLQQLKKRKIQELQRKRQLRKSVKKNEEQKKSQQQKSGKMLQTFGRKTEQKISEDPQPPKMKTRQKTVERQNKLNPKENYHESNYGVRVPKKSHNNVEKQKIQNMSYRPVTNSFSETPKTIQSQNRAGKSRNKNTIFRQSPSRNEKSANKYLQQPKIQPKQRKNTFSKQSNKKLMMNAISNVCLPGQINRKQREKLLEVIENEPSQFFVFLFKEYSRKVIKAIYVLDHTQTTLTKIYGDKAPHQIVSEQVSSFYRFDSGCRQFKKLDGCKSFSLVVHAIDFR